MIMMMMTFVIHYIFCSR